MEYVGLLLAVLVGFTLGLLGGGGSILAVPIFVYVFSLNPALAMAASLAVVGITSFVGSVPHYRAGNLEFRTAALFALSSIAGSWGGVEFGLRSPDFVRMVVFACVMLFAAFMMLRGRKSDTGEERKSASAPILIVAGLSVGLLIGFVGVGGGFMYVPALLFLVGLPMNRAVGTSLMIIGISSMVAFVRNLLDEEVRSGFLTTHIGELPLIPALLIFLGLMFVGVFGGSATAKRTEPDKLRKWFAVFLLLMATFIIVKEFAGSGS